MISNKEHLTEKGYNEIMQIQKGIHLKREYETG
jgi:hypothetical protein